MKNNKIIFVAVMMGTITSVSVLLAMDRRYRAQQQDPQIDKVEQRNRAVPAVNLQTEPNAAIQEVSPRRTESQAIEGQVMDSGGKPVRNVEVVAMKSEQGALLKSRTDENGQFSFKGVPVGTYEVFAKAKDGPICPTCPFYSGGDPQRQANVHVLDRQDVTGIVIQTTPEWAQLTGRVMDAENKEPIVASTITLRRADNQDYYLMTGPDEKGNFTIPVPSTPITVEVSAAGYETWRYSKNGYSNRSDLLKLNIGETKPLTVLLRH